MCVDAFGHELCGEPALPLVDSRLEANIARDLAIEPGLDILGPEPYARHLGGAIRRREAQMALGLAHGGAVFQEDVAGEEHRLRIAVAIRLQPLELLEAIDIAFPELDDAVHFDFDGGRVLVHGVYGLAQALLELWELVFGDRDADSCGMTAELGE